MRNLGKKGKEWLKARKKLVRDAEAGGRIELVDGVPQGICEDCGKWRILTPDHLVRRSQGGLHDKSNIDWVCFECHDLRDNMGDPRKKKPKSKKPAYARFHKCKHCKAEVAMLICPHCGKKSL